MKKFNKKIIIPIACAVFIAGVGGASYLMFHRNKEGTQLLSTTSIADDKVKEETSKEEIVTEAPKVEEKLVEKKEELQFQEKKFTGKTTEVVNFRKDPKDNGELIRTLGQRSILEVLGIQGDWAKVKFQDKEGWISSKYVAEYTAEEKRKDDEEVEKQKQAQNQQAQQQAKQQVQQQQTQQNVQTNSTQVEAKKEQGFNNPAFNNSSQVVLVTTNGMGTSYANIKFYQKSNGHWNLRRETNGRVGENGLAYIQNRVQSTNKSPAGILNIISAFRVANNPGSKYSYAKVTDDMYWNLNSGTPTYNRLIHNNPGGDFEHLSSYPGQYKYALVTDYNYNQAANKGGAIFIHVNGNGGTGGCVSMPEGAMRDLITWVDPGQNPKVVIIPNSDLNKYWY